MSLTSFEHNVKGLKVGFITDTDSRNLFSKSKFHDYLWRLQMGLKFINRRKYLRESFMLATFVIKFSLSFAETKNWEQQKISLNLIEKQNFLLLEFF